MEAQLEDTPELRKELQKIWQSASLKLVENGAPAPNVFEAMFIVGLAGLVEVEGKILAARRLAQVAQQLADQAAEEASTKTVN